MGNQAEFLEDDADTAAEPRQPPSRHGDDVFIEQFDEAAARALGEIEELQQACLARTRRPGEEIEAAFAQGETEIGQSFGTRAVAQADIVELYDAASGVQNPPPLSTHYLKLRRLR